MRTPSDICDELGLSVVLRPHGWTDIVVVCGRVVHSCSVSGVFTDAVAELLALSRAVLHNSTASIALHDEPGGHLMSVTADAEQQHTMLLAIEKLRRSVATPTDDDGRGPIVSARVKRRQLLGLFMAELWKVQSNLREPSFQKDRPADFPAEALQALNREWDAHPSLGPSFLK